jgi:hypothetical protein
MDRSIERCIAYREGTVNGAVVFVPCGQKPKVHGKARPRFCSTHEKAYREILLGILNQAPKERER